MDVVLISTYELGRQPFGLASPAAWLKQIGVSVTCIDLAVEKLTETPISEADLVAFYVPMHTATRLAVQTVKHAKKINPSAHLCFYGLYAPMNEAYLRKLGAGTILGGEFESGLVELVKRLSTTDGNPRPQQEPVISLSKQAFLIPDRNGLPELDRYAYLILDPGTQHIVGYTEASRGCKHLCRHCPIVPVYGGRFRIVQRDVVLEDIRQQVEAGAQHITFGDADFFNAPGHAIPLVQTLHEEFPDITYDATIKIQHLLKHSKYLPVLKHTGCLFVTSAVEAVDNRTLEIYDKHHTREDFIEIAHLFREVGLTLNPTFVTFSPWMTVDGYLDLLTLIKALDLVDNVSPIQYAIRLLIPAGSRLLELPEVHALVGEFDEESLYYPWEHPQPRVDQLHAEVLEIVETSQAQDESRRTIFERIWRHAHKASGLDIADSSQTASPLATQPIPYLSESWYC